MDVFRCKSLFLLLVLILTTHFVDASNERSIMIQQAIQKENENFFFPLSMQLDLLKNCPQVIPTLAQWLYEEWHPYDALLTEEKLIHAFTKRLNSDSIPIVFVVLKNDMPMGVISLKMETSPEFSDFPENSIWMGSLYVLPEERNLGVGSELLKFVQTIAKQFGYENLYFYTSNFTNVKWYLKRGAHLIGERPFRNHRIAVMQIPLTDM